MALKDLLQQLAQGSNYTSPDVLTPKTKRLARRAFTGVDNAPRLQRNVQNLSEPQRIRITAPKPQTTPIARITNNVTQKALKPFANVQNVIENDDFRMSEQTAEKYIKTGVPYTPKFVSRGVGTFLNAIPGSILRTGADIAEDAGRTLRGDKLEDFEDVRSASYRIGRRATGEGETGTEARTIGYLSDTFEIIDSLVKAYGITSPGGGTTMLRSVGFSGVLGGAIPLIQSAKDVIEGKPARTDLGGVLESSSRGAQRGMEDFGAYQLASALVGVISQLPGLAGVAKLNEYGQVGGDQALRESAKNLFMNVIKRATKATAIETPLETIYYTFRDLEDPEKWTERLYEELVANGVMNNLFGQIDSGLEAIPLAKQLTEAIKGTDTWAALRNEAGFVGWRGDFEGPKFEGGSLGPGRYYSLSKNILEQEGVKNIQAQNVPDPKNPLIIENSKDSEELFKIIADTPYATVTEYAKANGYDGVIAKDLDMQIDISDLPGAAKEIDLSRPLADQELGDTRMQGLIAELGPEEGRRIGSLITEIENISAKANPTSADVQRLEQIRDSLPDNYKPQVETPLRIIRSIVPATESTTNIPPELEPLAQEAKKYKSAEEFVLPKEISTYEEAKVAGYEPNVYRVSPNEKTQQKIARRIVSADEKTARQAYSEWQKQVFAQEDVATRGQLINDISKKIRQNTAGITTKEVDTLKDVSNLDEGFNTFPRIFKEVYGDKYPQVKKELLDPFDKSKGNFAREFKSWGDRIEKDVIEGLNIKPGSRESELVQAYGEKRIDLDELKRLAPSRWGAVVEADKLFRSWYDQLLNEINASRKQIYPNNPDKIIPRRSDYYRHFRELSQGFEGLKNIFDTPANITSTLAGVSDFTQPKSKWQSIFQRRTGDNTEMDAVGGFLNYYPAALYAKHIDPHTAKIRTYRQELAEQVERASGEGRIVDNGLNNFLEYLHDWANDLAGKTNPLDRSFQKYIPGGRKTFRALNWLNSRIKSNVILGNAASSVAQIFNLPQGIASAKQYSYEGFTDTVRQALGQDDSQAIKQSDFIEERYMDRYMSRFNEGLLQDTKRFAAWMVGALDGVGTRIIWNSHYKKALAENIQDPIKYADDMTRHLVGGRGIGEVPLAQKAKTFQLAAPFQLEVGNAWYVMKDFVKEKDFGALSILFISSYLMNRAAEQIRGSDVVFDPIDAFADAVQTFAEEPNKGVGLLRGGGRLAGEVLSNIPLGQTVANLYPEYGVEIGGENLTRKELFGDADPTRYGTGILAQKGLQDPLFKVLPPFGGAQIKKTLQGLDTAIKGYSDTGKDAVRYMVERTPQNIVKLILFGEYSVPEARQYFDEDRRPLGEKQSEIFRRLDVDSREAYMDQVHLKRDIEKVRKQLADGKLTYDQAAKKIADLRGGYVHFMPDGTQMEGFAHEGAVPGTTVRKKRVRVSKPSRPSVPAIKISKPQTAKAKFRLVQSKPMDFTAATTETDKPIFRVTRA